ncbi:MAG: DNA-directed RNA polymerase subunit omega [Mariprofundales bacterium]|nr:DNA-directed RNA polymerase subunit omega [Mariprofundales bacterium]
MARVTIEDCNNHFPNRFEMTVLAFRRARQLLNYMPPMLDNEDNDKPTVLALREVGAGIVDWKLLENLDQAEHERQLNEEALPI